MVEIAPFLGLLDRLTDLLSRRAIRKGQLFDRLVDPLFSEFEPIAQDYIHFFQESERHLEYIRLAREPRTQIVRALEDLQSRRNTLLLARRKTEQFALAIRNGVDDPQVRLFSKSIVDFFDRTSEFAPEPPEPGTPIWSIVGFFQALAAHPADSAADLKDLEKLIKNCRHRLLTAWTDIAQQHAALRVLLLRS